MVPAKELTRPNWALRFFVMLFVVMTIYTWLTTFIDPGVTLGEAIAIALTTLGMVAIAIAAFLKYYKKVKPFKMRYCDQPTYISPGDHKTRIFRNIYGGRLGQQKITVELKPRLPIELKEFDLRIVTKRFRYFGPTTVLSKDIGELEKVATRELQQLYKITPKNEPDDEGVRVHFEGKLIDWVIGEPLWLEVEMNAKKAFYGYLSFRAKVFRRSVVRKRIVIKDK